MTIDLWMLVGTALLSFSILFIYSAGRFLTAGSFNKLKQFRHVATRYDRHASTYLAFAKLAAIRL